MSAGSAVRLDLLRRCSLFDGLTPTELQYIADLLVPRQVPSGATVYRQNDPGEGMFLVARGRVKCVVEQPGDAFQLLDYIDKGDHFGDLELLTGATRSSTATAVMDTDLLELGRDGFQKLMMTVPGFAANLSRSLGFRLHGGGEQRSARRGPAVIALVNSTLRTQSLIRPLAAALVEAGEKIQVFTDRPRKWPQDANYLIERIPEGVTGEERARVVHERLTQVLEHQTRVLFDLTQRGLADELPRLLAQCEEIWWLVDPLFVETSEQHLSALLAAQPEFGKRTHLVWILRESERFPPTTLYALPTARLDFKIVVDDDPALASLEQRKSISRLVRHLRGTRIGLALGGGGARGLAHLGALRALDRAEIFFDLLSGTSVGALMGASYCAGWAPQSALEHFVRDLSPPQPLRMLPTGASWYMWAMYFFRGWEGKLRRYIHHYQLEQFRIPLSTVAVDLVTGAQVIRDTGDAVDAILESINLPIIARPILRDGMALVDGGILNNVPADVLLPRGAEAVVAIDVASKLPQRFAGNTPGMATEEMKRPGPIETVLRVNEVQDHGLLALQSGAVDLRIAIDTSAFEFADFRRATELADVGEAATEESLPQLHALIADLENAAARATQPPQDLPQGDSLAN